MALIGREALVDAVSKLLELPDHRVITLTGPGGVGKTALAEAVAAATAGDVVVVKFASVPDIDRAMIELGNALGVVPAGAESWEARIIETLRHRSMLLVLDNLEHLPLLPIIPRILAACPDVKLIITTRGLLQLSNELLIQVPPLEIPDATVPPRPDTLQEIASVQLLVERAQLVAPGFVITEENAPYVARLCIALDGLPLAIELTAARLNMFSPQTLCERLGDRFEFLVGGPLDRPEHQRALRSALAWSYDLLGTPEQGPFYRFSVFSAPVPLEMAMEVCQASMEQLMALSDRNLLSLKSGDECTVSMLDSMKLFAQNILKASGEEDATWLRLAHACLEEATQLGPMLISHQQPEALAKLDALLPNINASLQWLKDHDHAELYANLACSLFRYWRLRGLVAEAELWLDSTVHDQWAGSLSDATRARALALAAFIQHERGHTETATRYAEHAIEIAERIDDSTTLGQAWRVLSLVDNRLGNRERATARMVRSLENYRIATDDDGIAGALNNLAILALDDGDWPRVVELCDESVTAFEALGNIHGMSHSLDTKGIALYELHRYDDAMKATLASLRIDRSVGDARGLAVTLDHVGKIARAQGDLPAAWEAHKESIEYRVKTGDPRGLLVWLEAMAHWLLLAGKAELTARVLGALEIARTSQNMPLQHHESADHENVESATRRTLGEERFLASVAKGRWASIDELIAEIREVATARSAEIVAGADSVPDGLAGRYGLTEREEEILRLIARRLTDKEIAESLFISARTVNRHVGNILAKLEVSSRREAAAIADREPNG